MTKEDDMNPDTDVTYRKVNLFSFFLIGVHSLQG